MCLSSIYVGLAVVPIYVFWAKVYTIWVHDPHCIMRIVSRTVYIAYHKAPKRDLWGRVSALGARVWDLTTRVQEH